MAKKKRKPGGDKPKKRRPAKSSLENLPDRRLMEPAMRELVGSLQGGGAGPDTPLARAQDLMYQAFEAQTPKRQVELAKEALAICPECADAYVLLAEHAGSRKEALELLEKGVAAGERALGPPAFQRDVGHFWGILETRPYMRARLELALALWSAGRRDEAVGHLQEMLRLNPNDNQGVRYTLAGFLVYLDRDEDLAQLLEQYPEDTLATWAYTRALLAFRQHGDTPEARALLKKAQETNKHIPAYLVGDKFPPSREPGYYSPGDESEALNYIASFLPGWKATPGAVAWLRQTLPTGKRKAETPRPKGPLGFIKNWLKDHLPQEDDTWQADFRQMSNWIRTGGTPLRPWIVLVTSASNDLVLAHELSEEEPSPALLWDALVQAMQHPAAGEPHRPTELQVRPHEVWQTLRPQLEEIGVRLAEAERLDPLEAIFEGMSEHISGKPKPGLLDVPGITPEQVGSFYEAAADFFRLAPWKKVGFETAIRVECDKFQSGPWYAVLMGQSGLTMGVAVYEDLAALRKLWTAHYSDQEGARLSVGTSVTYGEEWTIPVADLEAARRYGWKVARPDAYPEVFHKERGLSVRPPLAWELELMEVCLRAIPDFVNRRKPDDVTREEKTVRVASGELKLVLSWVGEMEE